MRFSGKKVQEQCVELLENQALFKSSTLSSSVEGDFRESPFKLTKVWGDQKSSVSIRENMDCNFE